MSSPLLDHLMRWGTETPDAPLFRFPAEDRRPDISWARTVDLVSGIAEALTEAEVSPGDRVVAQVPSCPESVLLCLATQWVGGVYVPLNPALGPSETALLREDADASMSVIGNEALAALMDAAAELGRGEDRPTPRYVDDPGAIIYTSGTTGRPKGAIVTHGNLASNARSLCRIWGFEPGDVTVHALPTFHAHGLFVAVNTAIVNGSSLLFLGRFHADRIVDALAGPGTVMMGVPTFYVRLLASNRFTPDVADGVRLFISGSAPLTEKVSAEFVERTGQTILERYGMSETEMITSNPLEGERIPGTVGFPLPDVEVRIRTADDPSLRCADVDEPGGIEVRGPNVFAGYWRMPERRSVDFTPDGWFRTGDLGTLDAEGRLRIVGRAKDLIISGGENVYPAEIEALLDQLPGVAESAVIGMPDDDFGELGLAVVVPDGPQASLDPAMLLKDLRARLSAFKVPRACVVVGSLPRNAMGKVQKGELRDRFAEQWPLLSGTSLTGN